MSHIAIGEQLSTPRLLKRGGVALTLALALNLLLVTAILTAEAVPTHEFLDYGPVVLWTTIGVVGATLVYGLVHRHADRPEATFARLAVIVLLLSWIPDVAIYLAGVAPFSVAISLAALHVPPAVVSIAVLTGAVSEGL